jgi:hypothetical protein
MKVSKPNRLGVLSAGSSETVARRGHSIATVDFAHCEDGQYRFGLTLLYSYGGFSSPIRCADQDFPTLDAARKAAWEEFLRRWPVAFASELQSVHNELAELRRQIKNRIRQPILF